MTLDYGWFENKANAGLEMFLKYNGHDLDTLGPLLRGGTVGESWGTRGGKFPRILSRP